MSLIYFFVFECGRILNFSEIMRTFFLAKGRFFSSISDFSEISIILSSYFKIKVSILLILLKIFDHSYGKNNGFQFLKPK